MKSVRNNTLIFIPTYNEVGNVNQIFKKIRSYTKNVDLLFLDDNSPDGTGKAIDLLAKKYKWVFAIHRKGRQGIGTAHLRGIKWAYQHKYKTLITMDCDLTHDPKDINKLLNKSTSGDIVLASRYLAKDNMKGWSLIRVAMTMSSHMLVKLILRKDYDASNAYRLYNLTKIPLKIFSKVKSKNYSFFFESLYIILVNGFKVVEIPTVLHSRLSGSSKMRFQDIFKTLKVYFRFFWIDKTGYLKKEYLIKNDR